MQEEYTGAPKKLERILPICFFAALLAGIALVVYVGCTFRVDDLLIDNQKAAPFNTGWQSLHADGTSDAVTLPCTVLTEENTAATLINQLPAEQDGEQVICIETSHQRIRAYVDQELLYEAGFYPKPAFGRIFGSAWHFIPIPQDAQGKTIRLEITIPYAKRTTDINGVLLGPKSAIVLQILKSNLTTLAFCITTFLLGVFFILIYGVLRKKRAGQKNQAYLYLALFVLLASVWALTDSKLMQFYVGQSPPWYLLSFVVFMLLPVPFLLFIREFSLHGRRFLDILCLLFLLNFAVILILYVTDIADLIFTVICTHVLIFVAVGYVVALCIREKRRYANAEMREIIWGLWVLGATSVIAIAQFYISDRTENSQFFRYGVLLFIVFLSVAAFRRNQKLFDAEAEAKVFRRLAYIDVLTQMSNRNAFDQQMHQLLDEAPHAEPLGFLMFYLNNLKKMNDTYGHEEGDRLIQSAAACIQQIFSALGNCFRIGGDEFAVILLGRTEKQIQAGLEAFEKKIQEHNAAHTHKIDVAYGYALADRVDAQQIKAVLRQADQRMYDQKASRAQY